MSLDLHESATHQRTKLVGFLETDVICFYFYFFQFDRPNVCTERKEEISDWNQPASSTEKDEERSEVRETTSTVTGGFHFSFNTCVEKSNKRTCQTV